MDDITRSQRMTMADIARLAGVSPSTVSRALSDNPLVNAKTRERVQALARAHNYRINVSARNFRLRRSNTIAVVAPADPRTGHYAADPFVMDLLASIADTAAEASLELLLAKGDPHRDWHAELIAACRADGILSIGRAIPPAQLRELASRGAPLVVWGARGAPDDVVCTVGSDNEAGGRAAAGHLLALGRRRIVFVGDPGIPEFRHRLDGYEAALHDAGLSVRSDFIVDVAMSEADIAARLGDRFARLSDFDGVFASSDLLAMAAIRALGERGLRVPHDVAVIGFDNTRLAAYSTPSLSTVDQRIAEGGRLMMASLRRLIAGEGCESHTIAPRLIVRGSCGGGPVRPAAYADA